MSDSPLTDWALDQIKAYGAEPVLAVGLVCVGAAFCVGWVIKAKVDIGKTREEGRKVSGDNTEKLAELRAAAISKGQVLDMCLQNMRNALLENKRGVNNTENLRLCRDEMCNIYQNEYLPAAITYVEMIPRLVDKTEALIRARTELLPRLESICVFLGMVNMEEMLAKINGSKPYKIKRAGRDGLILRVKNLIPWWCCKLRWKIRTIRKSTDRHLRD